MAPAVEPCNCAVVTLADTKGPGNGPPPRPNNPLEVEGGCKGGWERAMAVDVLIVLVPEAVPTPAAPEEKKPEITIKEQLRTIEALA